MGDKTASAASCGTSTPSTPRFFRDASRDARARRTRKILLLILLLQGRGRVGQTRTLRRGDQSANLLLLLLLVDTALPYRLHGSYGDVFLLLFLIRVQLLVLLLHERDDNNKEMTTTTTTTTIVLLARPSWDALQLLKLLMWYAANCPALARA